MPIHFYNLVIIYITVSLITVNFYAQSCIITIYGHNCSLINDLK